MLKEIQLGRSRIFALWRRGVKGSSAKRFGKIASAATIIGVYSEGHSSTFSISPNTHPEHGQVFYLLPFCSFVVIREGAVGTQEWWGSTYRKRVTTIDTSPKKPRNQQHDTKSTQRSGCGMVQLISLLPPLQPPNESHCTAAVAAPACFCLTALALSLEVEEEKGVGEGGSGPKSAERVKRQHCRAGLHATRG